MAKYKPENPEISKDNIKSFVQDFIDGKLKVISLIWSFIGTNEIAVSFCVYFINIHTPLIEIILHFALILY